MSNMLNQQLEKDKHRGTKSSRKHTAKERASASHAAADAAFEESEFGADRANDADGVNETFGKQDASHNERSPQRQSHAVASEPVRPARTTFRVQRLPTGRVAENDSEAREYQVATAAGDGEGTSPRPGTRGGEMRPATPAGRQVYMFPRHLLNAPPPKLPSRREAPRRPQSWSDRRWERWIEAELERTRHRLVLREELDEDEKKARENGNGDEDEDEKEPDPMWKRALMFSIRNLILILLICLYIYCGALLFRFLEVENSKSSCITLYNTYLGLANALIDELASWATVYNSDVASMKAQFFLLIQNYTTNSVQLYYSPTNNCTLIDTPDNPGPWSMFNALLFALTIITTIGYGNVYPYTNWGKLSVIGYAVLGIPLMLVFLANIGTLFAYTYKYLFLKLCCLQCWYTSFRERYEHEKKEREKRELAERRANASANGNANGSAVDLNRVSGSRTQLVPDDDIDEDESDEEEDGEAIEEQQQVGVPISFCMGTMTIYLFIGAAIFNAAEGWELLTCAYFSFVTLATIGFGDYYPGKSVNLQLSWTPYYLAGAFVYMIIGMALISMCLSLISEEAASKFYFWSQKVARLCSKLKRKKAKTALANGKYSDGNEVDAYVTGPDVNINIVEDKHDGEGIPMANMAPGEEGNGEQKPRARRNLRAFIKSLQNRAETAPTEGDGGDAAGEGARPGGGEEKEKPAATSSPSHPRTEVSDVEKERGTSSRARSAPKSAADEAERRQPSARSAGGQRGANRAAAAEGEQLQEPNKTAWTDDFGSSEV